MLDTIPNSWRWLTSLEEIEYDVNGNEGSYTALLTVNSDEFIVLFERVHNDYHLSFWNTLSRDEQFKFLPTGKNSNSSFKIFSGILSIMKEFISKHHPFRISADPFNTSQEKLYIAIFSKFKEIPGYKKEYNGYTFSLEKEID